MHINDSINQAIILSIIAVVVAIVMIAIAIYKSLIRRPQEAKRPFLRQLEPDVQALTKRIQQLENEKDRIRLELWKHKRKPSGIVGYILLALGAIAIECSIILASYTSAFILAFIGLGLTFWGVLFLFVRPVRYVKSSLLNSTAISTLTTVDHVINDLNYKGKGIHLPPRYLKGIKEGTVFIPSGKDLIIPTVEEVAKEKVFLKNPEGICLTPSGLGLANLFEQELGTNFAKVDLNYLQNNLPKLFIEGLEIAEDLEINVENNLIHVKIKGTIYNGFCNEVRKLSNICNSLGCPLCSSIAIALTRTTGKPVIIEKNEPSTDSKTIETSYRILEE